MYVGPGFSVNVKDKRSVCRPICVHSSPLTTLSLSLPYSWWWMSQSVKTRTKAPSSVPPVPLPVIPISALQQVATQLLHSLCVLLSNFTTSPYPIFSLPLRLLFLSFLALFSLLLSLYTAPPSCPGSVRQLPAVTVPTDCTTAGCTGPPALPTLSILLLGLVGVFMK